MSATPNTGTPHTARLARGVRGVPCRVLAFIKTAFCVLLALTISLVPLDAHVDSGFDLSIQKSEAHANPAVIAGAGAALTALAAELGISETALMLGIGACAVGATGLAWSASSATYPDAPWLDGNLSPAPGFAPWDDLTPAQKEPWIDQGQANGTTGSKEYWDYGTAWWALQYGLVQEDGNGGFEPTPEPDPDNDPSGHGKWQKARNVMIALAAGGGSVAFNEAVGPLIDNAANSIHDMLFGGASVPGGSLDLQYTATYTPLQDWPPIVFVTIPGMTLPEQGTEPNSFTTNNWLYYGLYNGNTNSSQGNIIIRRTDQTTPVYNFTARTSGTGGSHHWFRGEPETSGTSRYWIVQNGVVQPDRNTSSNSYINVPSINGDNDFAYVKLNAQYGGSYVFPDGVTYQNGKMTGGTFDKVDYGQLYDTPSGLTQNILNNTTYNNWANSYTDDALENYKRAITVPSQLSDPNYVPSYEDFVKITPDSDVTTIPSDEQLIGTKNPTPSSQRYQKDFGKTVGQLLTQPLENLFPFCLITDLYRLTQMIEASIYPSDGLSTQDINIVNGTSAIIIPLDDFGVEGLEDLELDLTPVIGFGNLVRPWTTAIFIVYLLVGSFRFFLNRGGE